MRFGGLRRNDRGRVYLRAIVLFPGSLTGDGHLTLLILLFQVDTDSAKMSGGRWWRRVRQTCRLSPASLRPLAVTYSTNYDNIGEYAVDSKRE